MFQPETVITAKVLKTGVWKELKHVATAASSFILLLTNWTCPPRPIKRCVVKTKPHPDCCFTVCVCGCSCLHNMFVLSVACASLNFNYQVVWPIRVPRFFKLGLQLTFYYPESSDNLCLTVQNTKIIQFTIIEEEEIQHIHIWDLYFAIFSLKNVTFLSMNWLFQTIFWLLILWCYKYIWYYGA